MPMTSRERVLTAINHEEPDRVPIVIGASNATGIKMSPYKGIKAMMGIDAPDRYIYQWPELGVRRQNLLDTKWPELRETLAHQVVL